MLIVTVVVLSGLDGTARAEINQLSTKTRPLTGGKTLTILESLLYVFVPQIPGTPYNPWKESVIHGSYKIVAVVSCKPIVKLGGRVVFAAIVVVGHGSATFTVNWIDEAAIVG